MIGQRKINVFARSAGFGPGTLTCAAFLCAAASIGSAILAIVALAAFVDMNAGLWFFWLMLLIAFGNAALVVVSLDLADKARGQSQPRTRLKRAALGAYALNVVLLVPAAVWTLVWVLACFWVAIQWADSQ